MADQPMSPAVETATVAQLQAETEKARAEAAHHEAEVEVLRLDAKVREAELARELLQTRERQDTYERNHVDDKYYHVYRFSSEVSAATVKAAIDALTVFHRLDGDHPKPITIIFNSPGGGVFAGMDLFDFILHLREQGHYVTTIARGMAASMAGILLQAGDVRLAGPDAVILIHEVSTMTMGKIGEIEDDVTLIHKVQNRVLKIFAARAAEAKTNGTAPKAFSLARFRSGWRRKDWWLTAQEALAGGVIDGITGGVVGLD